MEASTATPLNLPPMIPSWSRNFQSHSSSDHQRHVLEALGGFPVPVDAVVEAEDVTVFQVKESADIGDVLLCWQLCVYLGQDTVDEGVAVASNEPLRCLLQVGGGDDRGGGGGSKGCHQDGGSQHQQATHGDGFGCKRETVAGNQ